MPDTEYRNLRREFNAKLREVSGHVAAARLFMNDADLLQAYEEAEKIQMTAFDAKDLLGRLVQQKSMPSPEEYARGDGENE